MQASARTLCAPARAAAAAAACRWRAPAGTSSCSLGALLRATALRRASSDNSCRASIWSGLGLLSTRQQQQQQQQQQAQRHRRSLTAAAAQQQSQQQQSLARSVRAVPITVLTVGKGNSRGAEMMASEWADKLRRYTKLTETKLPTNPKNAKEPSVAQVHEGERVLKAISPGDRVVLLDERGRDVSSEDLARLLAQASDQGWPNLVFCIGGPFGHAPAVRERGDDTIRLSKMVLNHQVAHIVLLEQLYRAWTILRGEPYHH